MRRLRWMWLLLPLLAAVPAEAGWVWSPRDGWRKDGGSTQTPAELNTEADKAFQAKRYREAARGYRMVLERKPPGPLAGSARLQLLESQFLGRDMEAAHKTVREILRGNPDAATISRVLQRKYEIGVAFLTGAPRKFLGFSVSAESRGIEILDSLVEQYPFQAFSDDALFHIGGHYMKKRQHEEAEVVYERLIRDYPLSEWAGIAEYQIGEAALRRLKGVEYDFTLVKKAEKHFRRYLRLFPGGDRAAAARLSLERIGEMRAARLLGIAEFYLRLDREKAARIYLQRLLQNHPGVPAAKRAQAILKRIGGEG
ncbi:MAG: outer membrane protein assembly factor BamD [Planctomycetota bacterium]